MRVHAIRNRWSQVLTVAPSPWLKYRLSGKWEITALEPRKFSMEGNPICKAIGDRAGISHAKSTGSTALMTEVSGPHGILLIESKF
jgi:hypothetical protein